MLRDEHREFLIGAGIDEALLTGITSEDDGIAFTLTGPDGRSIVQRRPDKPRGDAKYLTEAGTRLVMPVPQAEGFPDLIHDRRRPVVIIEGTKQHLAGASALIGRNTAVIGTLGCTAWMHDGGQPLPDLYAVDWDGRDIFVCFDADFQTKPGVWDAADALTDFLTVAGGAATVRYVKIPGGGDNGLDDFLRGVPAARRPDVMQRLLNQAENRMGRRPKVPRNPFIGDGGLKVLDLWNAISAEFPMATMADQSIAVYGEGRYWNGNSRRFSQIVTGKLGNDQRPAHLTAVTEVGMDILKGEGRVIPERQNRVLLNVKNGLLDPVTMELHPHTPDWRSTVQFDVNWNPKAECPLYDRWIEERIGQEQVEPLHQVTSIMLDPTAIPMKALFLFGPTRSGKSTYSRLLETIVGPENTAAVRLHDMEHQFAVAELYSKVLNIGADLPAGHIRELSLFKQTTGGDRIGANKKYGQKFEFTNYALSCFTANEVSTVGEVGGAYFDRMHPVFFANSYAGAQDPTIEGRLKAEREGIFRRWVEALGRRLARPGQQPMDPPTEVRERFEQESDPVRLFLAERTKPKPAGIGPVELFMAYQRWCEEGGRNHPLGRTKFLAAVASAGFPARKSNGSRKIDLVLRDDRDDTGTNSLTHTKKESDSFSREGLLEENVPNVPVDLETASADLLHEYGPGFIRLVGTPAGLTTDPRPVASCGKPLIAHNGLNFDFVALARYAGLDFLAESEAGRLIDTKVAAILADPPTARMTSPERYYGLDRVAERLGLPGKTDDLKRLAKEYGGFDRIPVDNPEFRSYLEGDVAAVAAVHEALPDLGDYGRREMRLMGRLAYAHRVKGWRVDLDLLRERLAEGQSVIDGGLATLAEFGLPMTKKDGTPYAKPHATTEGREAVLGALQAAGVDEYPLTEKGALATSQDAWDGFFVPAAAAPLLQAVWALNGNRTVYQTIDSHRTDDRVYPSVMPFQASGRFSITKPGLTVMGKRGGRHVERAVFLPDEGDVLMSFDLDQIDARAIAMHSGDEAYAALFCDPDIDAHEEVAFRLWGVKDGKKGEKRNAAKAISHGWNYGEGLRRIAESTGLDYRTVESFDAGMRESFPTLVRWQSEVRDRAASGELLDNGFGRMMRPQPDRAHTQGPALMGQGLARDLMAEGILRLPLDIVPMLRGVVHDEVVFSVPRKRQAEVKEAVLAALSFEYMGVPVTAGFEGSGKNWAAVYEGNG